MAQTQEEPAFDAVAVRSESAAARVYHQSLDVPTDVAGTGWVLARAHVQEGEVIEKP